MTLQKNILILLFSRRIIESKLKNAAGQGENTIFVAKEGGEFDNLRQSFEGRTPMKSGGAYIFFLSKDTTEKNRYKFGGDPYKFKVSGGRVEVDSTSEKVKEVFQVKSEKQFINEILNVNEKSCNFNIIAAFIV